MICNVCFGAEHNVVHYTRKCTTRKDDVDHTKAKEIDDAGAASVLYTNVRRCKLSGWLASWALYDDDHQSTPSLVCLCVCVCSVWTRVFVCIVCLISFVCAHSPNELTHRQGIAKLVS